MLAYFIRHETVPWSFQYSSVTSVKNAYLPNPLFVFLVDLCFQDIVIGTPGRMKDLIEMGICHLNEVSFVVSQFCLWLCYSCLWMCCAYYICSLWSQICAGLDIKRITKLQLWSLFFCSFVLYIYILDLSIWHAKDMWITGLAAWKQYYYFSSS